MNIPYILLIHCKCNFSSVVEQRIVNNTSEEKIGKHEPQSLFKAKETKNCILRITRRNMEGKIYIDKIGL